MLQPPNTQDYELSRILEYLKDARFVDFSGYKTGTIRRRLELRIARTGTGDAAAYYRYLTEHPAETDLLLETMTVSVSHFFRNPAVFELLGKLVLPELIAANKRSGLRIWCAGCARGEEAYSVAILLRELFLREGKMCPVLIIATDLDRNVLARARRGYFRSDEVTEVRKEYLDRYFIHDNGGYRLREEITSMVTFVRHDLTLCLPPRDGIFSDYHLILCRNTLIYFNRDVYERVLLCITAHLAVNGCLVLGEAETIPACCKGNFPEISPRSRIFLKEAA